MNFENEKEGPAWIDGVREIAAETRGHTSVRKKKAAKNWTSMNVRRVDLERIYKLRDIISGVAGHRVTLAYAMEQILNVAEGEIKP